MFNQVPPQGFQQSPFQQHNPFHTHGGYHPNSGMNNDPLVRALQSGLMQFSTHPTLAAAFLFIMNVALHKREQLTKSPEALTLACGVAFLAQAHMSPTVGAQYVLHAADRIKKLFADNPVDVTTYRETSDVALAADVSTPGLTRI